MIGGTVAHKCIVERLGGGRRGAVHKADDLIAHRSLALTFLPPELTRDDDAKPKLLLEACAAAQLGQPEATAPGLSFCISAVTPLDILAVTPLEPGLY